MLALKIECPKHSAKSLNNANLNNKIISIEITNAFEIYSFTNFTRIFKILETHNPIEPSVSSDFFFYEEFISVSYS